METRKVIVALTLGGSAGRAGHGIDTASVRHFQSASVCLPAGHRDKRHLRIVRSEVCYAEACKFIEGRQAVSHRRTPTD